MKKPSKNNLRRRFLLQKLYKLQAFIKKQQQNDTQIMSYNVTNTITEKLLRIFVLRVYNRLIINLIVYFLSEWTDILNKKAYKKNIDLEKYLACNIIEQFKIVDNSTNDVKKLYEILHQKKIQFLSAFLNIADALTKLENYCAICDILYKNKNYTDLDKIIAFLPKDHYNNILNAINASINEAKNAVNKTKNKNKIILIYVK